MQSLPLAPFLTSLTVDGMQVTIQDYVRISLAIQAAGPWTIARLRGVLLALLVRDEAQEAVFVGRFNSFFSPTLETETALSEIDLARALADLRTLAEAPVGPGPPVRARDSVRLPPAHRPAAVSRWQSWAVGLVLLVWCLAVGGDTPRLFPEAPLRPGVDTPLPPVAPSLQKTLPETLNLTPPADWQTPASVAALLLLAIVLYSLYLWRSRRMPQDQAPPWDPDGPRTFRAGAIGGPPAPWLDAETLDRLADALGYFQSAEASAMLNVAASIEATGQQGGIPSLVFRPRKQLRRVLILEDALAQATAWNPVARELAAGLAQRGVPVICGTWQGSLHQFRTPEGTLIQLDDLEDARHGYVVLLCSDSKSLHPQRDTFVLESLRRWPMVAWMELREPRSWDESTALVAHYGFPIYPATRHGLLQAMGHFLTERGARDDTLVQSAAWHGLPTYGGTDLQGYLEYLLGDALPWAQACAMVQPVPPGLADALRRAFCPELPPERLERLFALPDTTRSVTGLRFTQSVLAALRRGFPVRWERTRQEAILRFLLDQLQQGEPPQAGSPAHVAWETNLERVRLELDPDQALKRLAALAGTPVGGAIRADLDTCVLPEHATPQTADIPLRVKPRTRDGLQRLARLAPRSGIPLLEAYPVSRWHRLALGVLVLAWFVSAGKTVQEYRHTLEARRVQIDFVLMPAGTFMMGSQDGEKDEQPVHQVTISKSFYLGQYEVTQAQWEAVMGRNPSQLTGDPQRPVETVSWEEVQEFIQRLNDAARSTRFRLPTEAEWEYAARAGTTTAYSFGDDATRLGEYAWYGENSGGTTHPVGQRQPNAWGLYDMHGNVWEWVQDWYGPYTAAAAVDPAGPASGSARVFRGGSWVGIARGCRSAFRDLGQPGDRIDILGFRLVRTAP